MMDVKKALMSCINALDTMTVTGRHNCTMIAGVCNDLEKILEVIDDDPNCRQNDVPGTGGHGNS